MSASVVQLPARFSPGEEIEIGCLLKAGKGIGGVRPRARLLFLALCEEGRERRMEGVFKEVERRVVAKLEVGDGHI